MKLSEFVVIGNPSDLLFRFQICDGDLEADTIGIEIFEHDEVAIAWIAHVDAKRVDDYWEGSVSLQGTALPRLLELAEARTPEGTNIELPDESLFLESRDTESWLFGAAANAHKANLDAKRNDVYGIELESPSSTPTDPLWFGFALVDRVLLGQNQYVPGLDIRPLPNYRVGYEIANALTETMRWIPIEGQFDMEGFVDAETNTRPTIIVIAPKIRAPTLDEGYQTFQIHLSRLLRLLSIRREAPGRPIGGVLAKYQDDGRIVYAGDWTESHLYPGNQVTGILGGEDQHSWPVLWQQASTHPQLDLWCSLFLDALREPRQEYKFFRFFNLLEGMASLFVTTSGDVLDDSGEPYRQISRPGNTFERTHARGKVFEFLRVVAASYSGTISSYSALPNDATSDSFWHEVGIWVRCRNKVAHEGTWQTPKNAVPDQAQRDLEARISRLGDDGSLKLGRINMVRSIHSATKFALLAMLYGKLQVPEGKV